MPWPYDRATLLIEPALHRPVFQGDLFEGVPIVKARAGDVPPESDPKLSTDRRVAMVIGYPCDIYDHGRLIKVQTVATLREGSKLGVPEDWDGAYHSCPLADPFDDGVLWAVDFLALSPVDRAYFEPQRRIASLSEIGLAHLRQRLVLYATRLRIPVEEVLASGQSLWDEIGLWDSWCAAKNPPEGFAAWLDEFDAGLRVTRRDALEAGRP